jgi:hypothetical protein
MTDVSYLKAWFDLELYFAYSVTQIYHSVHGGVINMWDISCFIGLYLRSDMALSYVDSKVYVL